MAATLPAAATAPRLAAGVAQPFRELAAALRSPACYPHPAPVVDVIETHISFVFLAGEHAYKIKKPVNLGFVDFSTLEARCRACEEEVRLNRRTAPDLYREVVRITGRPAAPVVGGRGPAIEYAVHMHRFPQEALLDALARSGRLTPGHVDALAHAVATFHASLPPAPADGGFGTPERVLAHALANFHAIEGLERGAALRESLESLREWTLAEHRALAPFLAERRSDGFVRECHGDLHLANVALLGGVPVPFDCIEFDPGLRWIDVMSEAAFTAMDLEHHRLPGLAARFLNAYLEETGDYPGLRVLRFYRVYRALVRAKVACIRAHQATGDERGPAAASELPALLALARRLARRERPALVLMHGLSGSGKTQLAQQLSEGLGAVRLRSDVERKRLHGMRPGARSGSAPGAGLYSQRENERTYGRLAELASWVLASGYPAIVDAAFLRRAERDAFRALASAAGASFTIASCTAPEETLRDRVAHRERAGTDASEAGLAVLALQREREEPLARDEAAHAVVVDTSRPEAARQACAAVARRLRPVRH